MPTSELDIVPALESVNPSWKKTCDDLLFPDDLNQLVIKQKHAPACYLFTLFDCIIHSCKDDISKLRSFFIPKGDGELEVRLPRSNYSQYLNSKTPIMQGKYEYKYDETKNQDVFIICKEKLNEILKDTHAVESNSLALKVLMHLVPYFFSADFSSLSSSPLLTKSTGAHRMNGRFEPSHSSVEAAASIIGFYTTKPSNDLSQLRWLTTVFPQLPFYFSMFYKTGRHALRFSTIIPDEQNKDQIVLINPWRSKEPEYVLLEGIESRKVQFATISSNPLIINTLEHCLKLDDDLKKWLKTKPSLCRELLDPKSEYLGLSFSEFDSKLKIFYRKDSLAESCVQMAHTEVEKRKALMEQEENARKALALSAQHSKKAAELETKRQAFIKACQVLAVSESTTRTKIADEANAAGAELSYAVLSSKETAIQAMKQRELIQATDALIEMEPTARSQIAIEANAARTVLTQMALGSKKTAIQALKQRELVQASNTLAAIESTARAELFEAVGEAINDLTDRAASSKEAAIQAMQKRESLAQARHDLVASESASRSNLVKEIAAERKTLKLKEFEDRQQIIVELQIQKDKQAAAKQELLKRYDLLLSELKKKQVIIEQSGNSTGYSQAKTAWKQLISNLEQEREIFFSDNTQNTPVLVFNDKVLTELDQALKVLKVHRGWHKINPIIKSILGVLAAIAVVPAIITQLVSKEGYTNTFFKLPQTDSYSILTDFNDKFANEVSKPMQDLRLMG